ncbi:MAG: SAM-dependent chlorinase/fluorinase [candidate division KSB1 bacterium]|nr:SAM-dependent chlorinase/fluorinase [candidate division KSB1 bacterium]
MAQHVTLTTDFGARDWFVGAVKAVLLRKVPRATIVDLSHALPAYDVRSAAYFLGSVFHLFPPGTVHLAVVDPGVGSERAAIAAEIDGRFFVGPDNGLITYCLQGARYARFVQLEQRRNLSPTFHARDLFAPAAADLCAGCSLDTVGRAIATVRVLEVDHPLFDPATGIVRGSVVYVDGFGNLITDLPNFLLQRANVFLHGRPLRTVACYADGQPGELVAVPGSNGTIEIAVREGSAQEQTGAGMGTEVVASLNQAAETKAPATIDRR